MFQYWALSYLQSLFSLHNWSKHGEILMWKVLQEGCSRHCKGWCSFSTVVGGWSPGFRSPVKHMHFAKNGETSVSRNTQVIHKASKHCYPILQMMPWCWESGYRPCGHSAGATLCSYSDTSLHKYAQNWRPFPLKQLGTFWVTGRTWIDTPYWQCCESWWFCVVAYCLFCQVNPKSVWKFGSCKLLRKLIISGTLISLSDSSNTVCRSSGSRLPNLISRKREQVERCESWLNSYWGCLAPRRVSLFGFVPTSYPVQRGRMSWSCPGRVIPTVLCKPCQRCISLVVWFLLTWTLPAV